MILLGKLYYEFKELLKVFYGFIVKFKNLVIFNCLES